VEENQMVNKEAEEKRINITNNKRRHIPLSERMKLCTEWDGKPYELTEEDRQWIDLPPAGNEIM
jgi:hypothetical protein